MGGKEEMGGVMVEQVEEEVMGGCVADGKHGSEWFEVCE